jgi:hypothetical protein
MFRKMEDPVRGTAQVVSCTMPGGHAGHGGSVSAVYNKGTFELVVSAEGVPATPVRHSGIFRTRLWPMPGQMLPVTVDRANPKRIKIHWDEVPSGEQQAGQQAQALAGLMNAQGTAAMSGTASLSEAGLSEDQAARAQQALGALGISDTSGVQVVRMQGAASGGEADPVEQLEKLAALHDSGALTDAEFEQQKQRILGEQ